MRVSEFRKDMRAYFDRAANGSMVIIERGGIEFALIKKDEATLKAYVKNVTMQTEQYKQIKDSIVPASDYRVNPSDIEKYKNENAPHPVGHPLHDGFYAKHPPEWKTPVPDGNLHIVKEKSTFDPFERAKRLTGQEKVELCKKHGLPVMVGRSFCGQKDCR